MYLGISKLRRQDWANIDFIVVYNKIIRRKFLCKNIFTNILVIYISGYYGMRL